jgi:hypothetical protein
MVTLIELDGSEYLRDGRAVELVRKVKEMVMLVTMRMGGRIPIVQDRVMRDREGRKESPKGVRCGGGGGRSAASSVGMRDLLEAEGELDQARVGRKECDRRMTGSEIVLIVPRSWSSGSAPTGEVVWEVPDLLDLTPN